MNPTKLDHVAYWVADRDAGRGLRHVAPRDARHRPDRPVHAARLERAPRQAHALRRRRAARARRARSTSRLRVSDLDAALAALPAGLDVERPRDGEAYFDVGAEGVRLGLVEAETDVDYDLDHVALFSRDPEETASEYGSLGFALCCSRHIRGAARRGRRRLRRVPSRRAGRRPSGRCSTISPCSSSRRTSTSLRRTTSASRSTTSSTRRTRTPCSSGAPSACASSTSSTSRRSR